jgi:uncharacterized membrane protein YuzA (DUF378 family)
MRTIDTAAIVLVVTGALNWGLVAVAEFDLVATLVGLEFGETNAVSRIIYGLVGLSGLWVAGRAGALLRGDTRERVMV